MNEHLSILCKERTPDKNFYFQERIYLDSREYLSETKRRMNELKAEEKEDYKVENIYKEVEKYGKENKPK